MAYRNVPASARAGLTARVMLVALIVPAVAPALGGWLVDSLSWRGIFFASVAPALLVLALAMRWLPRHKHAAQRLDLRGLLLGSAALATLLVALAWLGSPGGGGRGLLLALLACVLGCCYWRDGRARTDALLDLGLLEAPLLRTAMLVYLCVPGAFMGANLVAMLYLQGPLGLSASRAGALMLPWALAAGLAIGLTRRRFNRWGPKSLLLAGMAIQAGGLLWLARSGEGSGFWQLAGPTRPWDSAAACVAARHRAWPCSTSRRRAWAMPAPCGTSIGNWRSAWAWPCSVGCSTCCRRGPTPRPSSTASCSPPLSRYCLCRG